MEVDIVGCTVDFVVTVVLFFCVVFVLNVAVVFMVVSVILLSVVLVLVFVVNLELVFVVKNKVLDRLVCVELAIGCKGISVVGNEILFVDDIPYVFLVNSVVVASFILPEAALSVV